MAPEYDPITLPDTLREWMQRTRDIIEATYCRLDPNLLRTNLPWAPHKPALVVPIDHDDVVPVAKPRSPFPALIELFDSLAPQIAATCSRVLPFTRECNVPNEPVDDITPYWNNVFFTGMDALLAYGFTRMRKPRRVVEIGSGHSTRFFRKAIADGKLATHLVSIDPSPRIELSRVADEIIAKSIIEVDPDYFATLEPGDILFFDGSHLCLHGTDVPHFFLRVLPRVAPGVLAHIHDIYLPEEYPEHFDTRYYSEQYMLAAFVLHNVEWSVVLPVHHAYHRGMLNGDGGSFWIERTGSKAGPLTVPVSRSGWRRFFGGA